MSTDMKKPVIGITHGDINGVGYEIIIKSLLDNRTYESFVPIIYGLSKVASYYRKALNINDFSLNLIKNANNANNARVNIINIFEEEIKVEPGQATEIAGKFAFKSLEYAVNDIDKNNIDAIVTAPINKKSIQSNNFKFTGHTEYFTSKYNVNKSLMMMVCDNLRIGIVTNHLPIKDISGEINKELIFTKLKIMKQSLIQDFGINAPRIAVLSLNPHASDDGFIGDEENNIIKPAIQMAIENKIYAFGPFAADGLFASLNYTKYDAILAMYHDQCMLPFKLLAMDKGVNFTAGLPIIRTSPAHGTAYDIAGKNMASPDSFRAALFLACDIYKNRIIHNEISANPLHFTKQEIEDN